MGKYKLSEQYIVNYATHVDLELLENSIKDFESKHGRKPALIMNDETINDLYNLNSIRYDEESNQSFLLDCPIIPLHYCNAYLA